MKDLIVEEIIQLLEGVSINKLHIIKCFIEGIKK